MKRNEIQGKIEQFITSNAGEFTTQDVKEQMNLTLTTVAIRRHLDNLLMLNKIQSKDSIRQMLDGRNHLVVVYYK